MLSVLNISNNAVCLLAEQTDASEYAKNLYESPELFRFQVMANDLLRQFAETRDISEWGLQMGSLFSSALSTFVLLPSAAQLSLAITLLYGDGERCFLLATSKFVYCPLIALYYHIYLKVV